MRSKRGRGYLPGPNDIVGWYERGGKGEDLVRVSWLREREVAARETSAPLVFLLCTPPPPLYSLSLQQPTGI